MGRMTGMGTISMMAFTAEGESLGATRDLLIDVLAVATYAVELFLTRHRITQT